MQRRRARSAVVLTCSLAMVIAMGWPAAADHTDPGTPQSEPTESAAGQPGDARGEGEWEHLYHAPPNPGSDHHYFTKNGQVYVSHGTLGQGGLFGDFPPGNHVGQRIIRLLNEQGEFDPEWVADHGSAACIPGDPGGTLGLQHDVWSTPPTDPELLLDATDATGRCHDAPTGGIEIIDISGLGDDDFEVREIHLTRFASTSHTLTVDDAYPWIVWSNNSAIGAYWMDFMDIRSCLTESAGGTLPDDADLETKRDECRPEAYRIPFEQEWTLRTETLDGEPTGPGVGCHDVTSVGTTIYCSAVDADVIVDISGMIDENGDVRGEPLPCEVVDAEPMDGLDTGAMVTDCQLGGEHPSPADEWEAWEDAGSPQAEGWEYLGHFNHPGRADGNNNNQVNADEGIAISHQTMPLNIPSEFGEFMVVSDERGGAVVPEGASCIDEEADQTWHGGLHFFDIADPSDIQYATIVDDDGEERRAVWRGEIYYPQPTMCVVHIFHHVSPDEQRLVMGYYRQGIKILDYWINDDGHFEFDEVASFVFPEASNVWTANVFNVVDNDDGTRTYFIGSSDIQRGFDVFSWTHEPHPIQEPPAPDPEPEPDPEPAPPVDEDPLPVTGGATSPLALGALLVAFAALLVGARSWLVARARR